MKNYSSRVLLFLLCVAVLGSEVANSQAAGAPNNAAYEVKIDNFSFNPPTLNVPAGSKVTWTNHDDIPHNVVSSDQKFKSKPLDTDQAFAFTFTEPGTYQYFCGLHPRMVGKILVEAPKQP